MTSIFKMSAGEHAALVASIAQNIQYKEDAATPAAIATQVVMDSHAAMAPLASVPRSPFVPNNPAHGHGALTKVGKTEVKAMEYALLAFSVVGIFDGFDKVEYYWSNKELGNSERAFGLLLGLAQVTLGVMMLTGALATLGLITLSGGGAAVASVAAITMLAYAAASAVRYLAEMGRSVYLAIYDAKDRAKHVWSAIKYLVGAVLNLCLVAQLVGFFMPMLKSGQSLLSRPGLQSLLRFGSKFSDYWQKFIVIVLFASVANFVWKTADEVNTLSADFAEMKKKWSDPEVSGWAKTRAVLKVIYKAVKILVKALLTGGLSLFAAWVKRRKANKAAEKDVSSSSGSSSPASSAGQETTSGSDSRSVTPEVQGNSKGPGLFENGDVPAQVGGQAAEAASRLG